jgi:hypothetical protein
MRGTPTVSAGRQGYYYGGGHSSPQGLTLPAMNMRARAMRSRLKGGEGTLREVTERKQVGDAEGMVNEEGAGRGASSEGLEQL